MRTRAEWNNNQQKDKQTRFNQMRRMRRANLVGLLQPEVEEVVVAAAEHPSWSSITPGVPEGVHAPHPGTGRTGCHSPAQLRAGWRELEMLGWAGGSLLNRFRNASSNLILFGDSPWIEPCEIHLQDDCEKSQKPGAGGLAGLHGWCIALF